MLIFNFFWGGGSFRGEASGLLGGGSGVKQKKGGRQAAEVKSSVQQDRMWLFVGQRTFLFEGFYLRGCWLARSFCGGGGGLHFCMGLSGGRSCV